MVMTMDYEQKYKAALEWMRGMYDGFHGKTKKPKWTEEDEQYLLVCKNALYKYQWSDKWDADIISKWLEDKLKQRMEEHFRPAFENEIPQKSKWSEEDSLMIDSIIDTMKWLEGKGATNMKIDWLKSLKQRMEE